MKSKVVYLSAILFVCHISNGKSQKNDNLIDSLFNGRRSYVADIPEKFRYHYNFVIDVGNEQITDSIKKFFSGKKLLDSSFFMLESIPADELDNKRGKIWTNDFIISYRWNALEKKVKIESNASHFRDTAFVKDIEDWNENVTNRSYYYWATGTGGGFILCTKVTFKSNRVEMMHSAFKSYNIDAPLYSIKEQPVDDYAPRIQVNCDWIIDDKREEVVWFLIGHYIGRGAKVFDCDGNEIEFEKHHEE